MKHRDEILLWKRYKRTREESNAPSLIDVADDELGMPYKRARYLALKWAQNSLIEWGVSWRVCWLTPLGEAASITMYGFEYDPPRDSFGKLGYDGH